MTRPLSVYQSVNCFRLLLVVLASSPWMQPVPSILVAFLDSHDACHLLDSFNDCSVLQFLLQAKGQERYLHLEIECPPVAVEVGLRKSILLFQAAPRLKLDGTSQRLRNYSNSCFSSICSAASPVPFMMLALHVDMCPEHLFRSFHHCSIRHRSFQVLSQEFDFLISVETR